AVRWAWFSGVFMKRISALSAAPFDSIRAHRARISLRALVLVILVATPAMAQVTSADYQRAQALRDRYESAAVNVPDPPKWVEGTHRFYYRRYTDTRFALVIVDADTQQKQPAFDHQRLAESLSKASGK